MLCAGVGFVSAWCQALDAIVTAGVKNGTPDDEVYRLAYECIWVTHAPPEQKPAASSETGGSSGARGIIAHEKGHQPDK